MVLPHLGELGRRAVLGDATHDLGRLDQRVVGAERHRTVTGRAAHGEPAPADALLPRRQGDLGALRRVIRHPAELGQHVIAFDGVPVVLRHPLGAVGAAGFLVGNAEVDDVALGAITAADDVAESHCHRRREVEHVNGTASPHLAVHQLTAERVPAPALWIDRHDVGVAHQAQLRRGRVSTGDARHERPAPWLGLEALDIDARSSQEGLQQVAVANLFA